MKNDVQPVIIRNPSSYESQASKIGRGRNRITILKKSCIHHDQRKKRTKKNNRITSSKRVRENTHVDMEKAMSIYYLTRRFHYPAVQLFYYLETGKWRVNSICHWRIPTDSA